MFNKDNRRTVLSSLRNTPLQRTEPHAAQKVVAWSPKGSRVHTNLLAPAYHSVYGRPYRDFNAVFTTLVAPLEHAGVNVLVEHRVPVGFQRQPPGGVDPFVLQAWGCRTAISSPRRDARGTSRTHRAHQVSRGVVLHQCGGDVAVLAHLLKARERLLAVVHRAPCIVLYGAPTPSTPTQST